MDDRDHHEGPERAQDQDPDDSIQADRPVDKLPKSVVKFHPRVGDPPDLHIDLSVGVVLGRSESFHKKYQSAGLGFIGVVSETTDDVLTSQLGLPVQLDFVSPHVIIVAGKRGSGKSYTMGVIAEELARAMERQEIEVAAVVIDTVDVFRQSVEPNFDQEDLLARWGLEARGFPIAVYIPRNTYISLPDEIKKKARLFPLAISPSELSASDWGYVLEKGGQFSTTMENLMGDVIDTLRIGYVLESGDPVSPSRDFSINEMIECIMSNPSIVELYKIATRTAMIQRLKRAQRLGIFHPGGTSAQDLAIAGQITVIDVAPLGSEAETVLAILTNMLCRQVLTYRMAWTDEGTSAREELPPTWLIVDEAHTLVPRSGNTPAKSAIVGYAKLGRRFGCSLILCTQQPSAVSDDAISQADLIISHALSLDSDIRALQQRAPAVMSEAFRDKTFISSLPRGVALVFDQTTENKRGFLVQIRPRISQHGGTDRLSTLFEAAKFMPPELSEDIDEEIITEPTLDGETTLEELPEVPNPPVKVSKENWDDMEEKMRDYVHELFERENQEFSIEDDIVSDTATETIEIQTLEPITPDSQGDLSFGIRHFGPLSPTLLAKVLTRQVLYTKLTHEFLFVDTTSHRDIILFQSEKLEGERLTHAVLDGLHSIGIKLESIHKASNFSFALLRSESVRLAVTAGESGGTICIAIVLVGSEKKRVEDLLNQVRLISK